mgnify:CR=1 FL=1
MRIGILVGRDDFFDYISKTELKRLLSQYKNPNKFFRNREYISTDIIVGAELMRYKNVEVDLILPREISVRRLLSNDVVFPLGYYLLDAFVDKKYDKVREIFKEAGNVFPLMNMQDFILKKGKYYEHLKRNKIPIAPTFSIYANDRKRNAKFVYDKVRKLGWAMFITKPIMSGWGLGFKMWNLYDFNPDEWDKYINSKLIKGYPGIILQQAVPGFKQEQEIRTYWFQGKYAYAVGTIHNFDTQLDDLMEERQLNKKDLAYCKKIGEKVMKILPKMKVEGQVIKPTLIRLDFGCCHKDNYNTPNAYFINEVEGQGANLFAEAINPKIYSLFAKTLYNTAKQLSISDKFQAKYDYTPTVKKQRKFN